MRPRPGSARYVVVALLVGLAGIAQAQRSPWLTPIAVEIEAICADLDALYVDQHRQPKLAFQEPQTAARLANELRTLGFEVTTGVGKTGVVGVLRNGAGPTARLRTELDALLVQERTGLPFATTRVVTNADGPLTRVPRPDAILSVGSIHGGTAGNITPREVRLQLSVRSYSEAVRARTLAAIRRVARGEAIAAGAPREPVVEAPERLADARRSGIPVPARER
jgi:metal-dependent amidase/aminoacylase/carboxypeptidase family protein